MTNIITVGEIPFDELRIGDIVISCTGRIGIITELYPVGMSKKVGRDWDDWGGGIKMMWRVHGPKDKISIAGWHDLKVQYVGRKND